eukprot:282483-Pleurochrysis_carterae.AAC.1
MHSGIACHKCFQNSSILHVAKLPLPLPSWGDACLCACAMAAASAWEHPAHLTSQCVNGSRMSLISGGDP